MPSPRHPLQIGAVVAVLLAGISLLLFWLFAGGGDQASGVTSLDSTLDSITLPDGSTSATTAITSTTTSSTTTTTTIPADPLHRWSDSRLVGEPYGTLVEGLLTFRGNPTRTYYGEGPVPEAPTLKWKFPDNAMCSSSTDLGVTSIWCGNGWTGQPVIWERPDGVTEMIFGAYDRKLHFVDAETGIPTRSPILTGDIIKGTPTIDPDGFPIVYFGSRDNKVRAVALDRTDSIVIWDFEVCLPKPSCPAEAANVDVGGRWNDDWDSSPLIMNDYMFEGSENSIYYIFRLNRGYDSLGLVTIAPEVVFSMPTWTDELMAAIGSSYPAVSVENSTAMYEGRVYFANSGGRVIGLDITGIESGEVEVVFDYWVGDDVDATIFVDEEGFIYVSAEYERYLPRAREQGQLIKLDPYKPDDPWVWGMYSLNDSPAKGGLWSTPALGDGVIYAVTHKGTLIAVDQETGEELWYYTLSHGSWSSPVIVDNQLIVASSDGLLRRFDLTDPRAPHLEWTFKVGTGSVEATPAVWKGMIYVGNRDGFMYAIGETDG